MQYKVLLSSQPFTYEVYQELEKRGLKVPYDPKVQDINIYAYLPLSLEGEISSILKRFNLQDLNWLVNEYEVNKNLKKVEIVNTPKINDYVYLLSEFKELPFQVIDIKNDVATIKAIMKNIDIVVEEPLDNLVLVDYEKVKEKIYTSNKLPENLSNSIYIDCDSIENDIRYLFSLILRLKLQYQDYEIVLLNPLPSFNSLINELKLACIYGDIRFVAKNINYKDYIYSNNLNLYMFKEDLVLLYEVVEGEIYQYIEEITYNTLGFSSFDSYLYFQVIKNLYHSDIIDKDIDFNILKVKLNQDINLVKMLFIKYWKDIENKYNLLRDNIKVEEPYHIIESSNEINYNSLINLLENHKLHKYIDNIEYFVYMIKS